MTTIIKEILGELSGLSEQKQRVAASVVHALWSEERSEDAVHAEWRAELDRRNAQLASGEVEAIDEASMESFVEKLVAGEG
ncbi:addiction module protein [Puniceicoccus vermicola]|uniref:Addiction module protein n=1 Tax=Puniceicoccus vermicola TaxID=388746 RepID=A0A7X1E5K3_9BACT|nr:addiction module protein [Puniceicoccus vermicola]MBC2603261.1 addiction module protein [Puniceicoccus vermicola]